MTDRELLELAANAAGKDSRLLPFDLSDWTWNPLRDDGDALRLAVVLKLEVAIHETESGVINGNLIGGIEKHGDDPYAATRRAIVRAAAEIGKSVVMSNDKAQARAEADEGRCSESPGA